MREYISRRFRKMHRLYHFTSYESACNIIRSGQFLFSKCYKLNDLIENRRITTHRAFYADLGEDTDIDYIPEMEMMRYQQISFAQDRMVNGELSAGFNLHTMWGLYADKGYGVCLVFDKDKLKLGENDYATEVVYDNWVMPDVVFQSKSEEEIRREIWDRKDEFFFRKRKEWEREQEYRIIRRAENKNDDEYLDISESLAFAIICRERILSIDEPIWAGVYYRNIRYLSNRKVHVMWYTPSMDGYCLYNDCGDPVWTEEGDFEGWD